MTIEEASRFVEETMVASIKRHCLKYQLQFDPTQWETECKFIETRPDFLVASLMHSVYGVGDASAVVEFSFPKTWFDMFKRDYGSRWWMRWAVKRWPIRWEKNSVTVTARALLPEIPVHAERIRFFVSKGQPFP